LTALRFALAGLLLTIPPCHPKNNCAPGHTWIGDRCLATDCEHATIDAFCVQDDGTTGNCLGGICQTVDFSSNDNCGRYGLVCPKGEACQNFYGFGYCGTSAGINYSCDTTTVCPSGYACLYGGCVQAKCGKNEDGQPCSYAASIQGYSYQAIGVCCDSACFDATGNSAADYAPFDDHHCGGCGIDCGSGACEPSYTYATGYTYSCVPSKCGKHDDGAKCALPDGGGAYYGQTGTCCGGMCSGLEDDSNCGVCGLACPQGLTCYYGYCANEVNGAITDCTTTPCPTGWACLYGYYCAPQDCTHEADEGLCTSDGVNAGNCCGGVCINRYGNDNKNCGACGTSCPDGTQCNGGTCAAVVDCSKNADNVNCQLASDAYGTCCNGQCQAYGTCGTACEKGDVRDANNICVHAKSGKPDNHTCTDDSDCPTGYGCVYGTCYQQSCPSGYDNAPCAFAGAVGSTYGQCCSGQCVDIYNDSSNCGSCGGTCGGQTTCQYGGCYGPNFGFTPCTNDQCPAGSACSAYGSTCETTTCKGTDDGIPCVYGIQNGYTLNGLCCAGQCVSTSSDDNCGACAASCGSNSCTYGFGYCYTTSCNPACAAGQVCAAGVCVGSVCDPVPVTYLGPPACAADDGTIGHCCSDGACEETLSDPQNCGGCGIKCAEGESCKKGMCSGGSKNCGPDRLYAFCDLDDGSTSKICCPGIGCVDTASDVRNCGGCGVACADGQICSSSGCLVPAAPAVVAKH
jgi:hypothetical protein